MERRTSYFEVFGHFMEIGGAAAAIIGVNLNFPLNWIVGNCRCIYCNYWTCF